MRAAGGAGGGAGAGVGAGAAAGACCGAPWRRGRQTQLVANSPL